MLVAAFHSPATTASFEAAILGIDVPGLLLRFLTRRFYCPFGLSTRRPTPVSPGIGCFFVSGPLQLPQLARKPLFLPPLPFGTVIPPDQSVQPDSWSAARLPKSPDLPSLPAAGFYL